MVSAGFCDVVARRYRLLASAEAWVAPSETSPLDAIGRALKELESSSGRRILGERGVIVPATLDGAGCDAIVFSDGRPLRLLALTVGKEPDGMDNAIDPCVAEVVTALHLDDANESRAGLVSRIASLVQGGQPAALLVVAGHEPAASDALDALARALTAAQALCSHGLPPIVFAASAAERELFSASLRQIGQRAQSMLPTIRQTEPSKLRDELRAVWHEQHVAQPVSRALTESVGYAPVPRLESLGRACQMLAAWRESPVWLIEFGATDLLVLRATPDAIQIALKSVQHLQLDDGAVELAEWLRRPWLAADDRTAIETQRGLTARAIAQTAGDIPATGRSEALPGLVIGRGVGLTRRLPAEDAAAAMCLGIGLTGPVAVALDRHSLLAGAGILLDLRPDAAADLIRDSLDFLGAVAIGRTESTDGACLQVEGGPPGQKAPSDVRPGELTILSALEWSNVEITLSPGRSVDVGSGGGRRQQVLLNDGEVGAVLTIAHGAASRRWAHPRGAQVSLSSVVRRPS